MFRDNDGSRATMHSAIARRRPSASSLPSVAGRPVLRAICALLVGVLAVGCGGRVAYCTDEDVDEMFRCDTRGGVQSGTEASGGTVGSAGSGGHSATSDGSGESGGGAGHTPNNPSNHIPDANKDWRDIVGEDNDYHAGRDGDYLNGIPCQVTRINDFYDHVACGATPEFDQESTSKAPLIVLIIDTVFVADCSGNGYTLAVGNDDNHDGRLSIQEVMLYYVGTCGSAVNPNNYALTKQGEVQAIQGLGHVAGNLSISGPVSDLGPLRALASVAGTLSIKDTELRSLHGLESLRSVGNLVIDGNLELTSLGMGLGEVSGSVVITHNPGLTSLEGLGTFSTCQDLILENDANLKALTGLENLTAISGELSVTRNESLTSLRGLSGLSQIGASGTVSLNDALTKCEVAWLKENSGIMFTAYNNDNSPTKDCP